MKQQIRQLSPHQNGKVFGVLIEVPVRSNSIIKFIKRLIIFASTGLAACVPLPGTTKHYQFEIALTSNGRHYDFRQFFECYQQAVLSENDGNFHRMTSSAGTGVTAADVGNGLVVLFNVGNCVDEPTEMSQTVIVLVNPDKPSRLYYVTKELKVPSIVIEHITVKPVNAIDRAIGPTQEQVELKERIKRNQSGFQSVTAKISQREMWATSEQNRAYFGRFNSVTLASIGEDPYSWGWPGQNVRFKFWDERKYPARDFTDYRETLTFTYDGEAFVPPIQKTAAKEAFTTDQTLTKIRPHYALVRYKGVLVKVDRLQEIFDPETQSILTLEHHHTRYPWGDSE